MAAEAAGLSRVFLRSRVRTELRPVRGCVSAPGRGPLQGKEVFPYWRPRPSTFKPATVARLFHNPRRRWGGGRCGQRSPTPGRVAKPGARAEGRQLGLIQLAIQSHRPETSGLLTGEGTRPSPFLKVTTTFLIPQRGFLSGHPNPGKTKDLGSRGTFSGAATFYFWGLGGVGYFLTRHPFLAPLPMPKPFLSPRSQSPGLSRWADLDSISFWGLSQAVGQLVGCQGDWALQKPWLLRVCFHLQ